MSTIAERVAAGAAFLDQREPGWDQRIDVAKLDLRAPCDCVLGQLATDFADAGWGAVLAKFGLRRPWVTGARPADADLGFNADDGDYNPLTAEWQRVIEQRRAATP